MKKRFLTLALALVLCAGLAVPALAAEDSSEVEITWLSEGEMPSSYNREFHYLTMYNPESRSYHTINLETGEEIDELDYMGPFSEGLAAVMKYDAAGNKKYGFINSEGEIVVSLKYDGVGSFSEGLAEVWKNGKSGYIDKTGKIVIPLELEFDAVWEFSDGLAMVRKNGKHGLIDKTGKIVVPPENDYAFSFSEGLASITKNGKTGFINSAGEIVVPLEYDYAYSFSEGLAAVRKGDEDTGKWGFIDETGKVVVPLEYDEAKPFSDGLARVLKQDDDGKWKWGFIDKTGKIVLSTENLVGDFSEGLAPVMTYDTDGNRKWGIIDKTGKVVVPLEMEYFMVDSFSDGLARVQKYDADGHAQDGLIDATGKEVVPPEYYHIWPFSDGLAQAWKNDADGNTKRGFIDKTGKVLVQPEYDEVWTNTSLDGLCYVKKGDRYGVFENPYYPSVEVEYVPPVEEEAPFTDASPWALEDLFDARDVGLTAPTDGMSYNQPITREKFSEVCVKLYEALSGAEAPTAEKNPFKDTENSEILKAYALGIINGTSADTFSPNDKLNRETAATMLMRAVNAAGVKLPSGMSAAFSDSGKISSWAKEAVETMASADVIRGMGDGTFAPHGVATVEQSIIMAMRIVNLTSGN